MKNYYLIIIIAIFLFLGGSAFAQRGEELCFQVITPAIGPTGICIEFSNSCIPEGWTKVGKCPEGSSPFPVAELGNCASRTECERYCALPENMAACLDFAEEHNLIPKGKIEMARKMLEMGDIGGPGGCKGKVECETYCDNPDHMEECIIFAKKYGLIPPEELEDVEKILAAIEKGARPPACHGKAACDAYCNVAEHFEECITFAEAAGFVTP